MMTTMMRQWCMSIALAAASGLVGVDARAKAEAPPPVVHANVKQEAATEIEPDPEIAVLPKTGALRTNWVPPGMKERYGHAAVVIDAPIAAVRREVLSFSRYKDLAPGKFDTSQIVGKSGDSYDVFLQVPVLHGALKLWDVIRFAPPRTVVPGLEVIDGTFVRGNVQTMHIVWTLRAVTAKTTLLKCDLLLLPNFPAPDFLLDEVLRDAAGDAVDGFARRFKPTPSAP